MMTLKEMGRALNDVIVTEQLGSKVVNNKRNYMIRIENGKRGKRIAFAGKTEDSSILDYDCNFLGYITEHNVRFYYYTYKRDCLKALNNLYGLGYKSGIILLN